jgi:hypothetical protein
MIGMNFKGNFTIKPSHRSDLMLEDAWATAGHDGKGEWKKRVSESDFTRGVEEQPMTMFFSIEELILECAY